MEFMAGDHDDARAPGQARPTISPRVHRRDGCGKLWLMTGRRIAAVVALALLLTFVVMNRETSRVWFFGIRAEMPLAFVSIVSALLGAAAGWLFAFVRPPKLRSEGRVGDQKQ